MSQRKHRNDPRITFPIDYDPMEICSSIMATRGPVKLDLPAGTKQDFYKPNQVTLLLAEFGLTPCLIRRVGSRWVLMLDTERRLRVAA